MSERVVKVSTQIAEWVDRGHLSLADVQAAFESAAEEARVLSMLTADQQADLVAASD